MTVGGRLSLVANKGKQKGTRWETAVLTFFRKHGLDYEKVHQLENKDEGDGVVRTPRNGVRVVVEAKAEQRIDLPNYLRQVKGEAVEYAGSRSLSADVESGVRTVYGAAVVKARNKAVGEAYVVMRLEDFVDLVGRWL